MNISEILPIVAPLFVCIMLVVVLRVSSAILTFVLISSLVLKQLWNTDSARVLGASTSNIPKDYLGLFILVGLLSLSLIFFRKTVKKKYLLFHIVGGVLSGMCAVAVLPRLSTISSLSVPSELAPYGFYFIAAATLWAVFMIGLERQPKPLKEKGHH
jgi:hypothetical protein